MAQHTWKVVTTADTPTLSTYARTDYGAAMKTIDVSPATGILLRGIGVGADGDTVALKIIAWPGRIESQADVNGPGLVIWNGTVTLGTQSLGTALPKIDEVGIGSPWQGTSGTFREAKSWVASGYDHAMQLTLGSVAILLLPTLGFPTLTCEITSLTTPTVFGLLWHKATTEGVF